MKRHTQKEWTENEDNIWGRFVYRNKWFIALVQRYGDIYDAKVIRRNKRNPELEMFKENLTDLDKAKELCEKKIDTLLRFASY